MGTASQTCCFLEFTDSGGGDGKGMARIKAKHGAQGYTASRAKAGSLNDLRARVRCSVHVVSKRLHTASH